MHGGSAPQVKKSAYERLAEMVDPILTEMYRIALSGEAEAVRVVAAKDLLDRAGYKPKERIEQSGTAVIEIVYSDANSADPALPAPSTRGTTADHR